MRKHPKWGRRRIALHYFLRKPLKSHSEQEIVYNQDYNIGPKRLKWVFNGKTKSRSIYKESEEGKKIELLNPIRVITTLSANEYILPKKLDHIHAFHPDYQQLIDHNQNVSFQVLKESPTLKSKLLIKQKGLCYFCNTNLLGTDGQHIYDGSLHIHHKESRASAGSKSRFTNLALAHDECHSKHKHSKP